MRALSQIRGYEIVTVGGQRALNEVDEARNGLIVSGQSTTGYRVEQASAELLESLVVNHATIAVATSGSPTLVLLPSTVTQTLIPTSAVTADIPELFLLLVDTFVSEEPGDQGRSDQQQAAAVGRLHIRGE